MKMKPIEWVNKTIRLNADRDLKVGNHFEDKFSVKGIVTHIEPWEDSAGGTIYVTLYNGCEEHYCLAGWKSYMRIID